MYPLTPLKAELIPLAKRTEGLGNEEVDYKLFLSLFWVWRTKRARHENDHKRKTGQVKKKETSSLFKLWPSFLMSSLMLIHLF